MPTKLVNGIRVDLSPEEIAALPVDLNETELIAANEARRIARIKTKFDDQDSVNKVLLKICFLQENRIRTLQGQPTLTSAEFRTWVETQID